MDKITLHNMVFFGHHGVMSEEKEMGQRFYVDVSIHLDLTKPGQTDDVEDTIDYTQVYGLVKEIFDQESYNLLERVATVICDRLWGTFQHIIGISVSVRKPSAPIEGVLDYAEITINRGVI